MSKLKTQLQYLKHYLASLVFVNYYYIVKSQVLGAILIERDILCKQTDHTVLH